VGTPREELADKLRQARLAAGYGSHGALAKALHVSRSVITKAESAIHPVPGDQLVTAWAAVTDVSAEPLILLSARVKSGTPEWFMPFRQAEAEATLLRYWQPLIVPGIAQTVAYMRALFEDEGHLLDTIDELAAARMERQGVIGHVPMTMILSQHVLHRLVRSPVIMADQMAHLASIAERPGVGLHILPDGINIGVWGALDIATRESIATVCLPTLEDIPTTAPGLIQKAMLAFERLLGAALPRAESLTLVRTAENQWKTQIS